MRIRANAFKQFASLTNFHGDRMPEIVPVWDTVVRPVERPVWLEVGVCVRNKTYHNGGQLSP